MVQTWGEKLSSIMRSNEESVELIIVCLVATGFSTAAICYPFAVAFLLMMYVRLMLLSRQTDEMHTLVDFLVDCKLREDKKEGEDDEEEEEEEEDEEEEEEVDEQKDEEEEKEKEDEEEEKEKEGEKEEEGKKEEEKKEEEKKEENTEQVDTNEPAVVPETTQETCIGQESGHAESSHTVVITSDVSPAQELQLNLD